ncbi:MAG: hypothetical protein H7066_15425 [Cytophagaceae bacterium]|nr:hypothetical protein [Gemmatimonadaceae bacterium]
MVNSIVARYTDGRIIKGTSLDVAQDRPSCHVRTADGEMVEVELKDLKALFFVKSLEGNKAHIDGDTLDPADPRSRGAKLIEVKFHDGERVVGLAMRFPPNKPFFFLIPADNVSNNLRILVNREQVGSMSILDGA